MIQLNLLQCQPKQTRNTRLRMSECGRNKLYAFFLGMNWNHRQEELAKSLPQNFVSSTDGWTFRPTKLEHNFPHHLPKDVNA